MTPTQTARRSDSLYHDNVTRRELCDRIAHLESDMERQECTMEYDFYTQGSTLDSLGTYWCSKCGRPTYSDDKPSYCVRCGAKVR